MDLAYKRVSTFEQNPGRQLDGLKFDKEFIDYCSGSTIDRPQFAALMDFARDGDTIHIHSIDRAARNLKALLDWLDECSQKNIALKFHTEGLEIKGKDDHQSRFIVQIFGAAAEFWLNLQAEARQEGIKRAQAAGKYKGKQINRDKQKTALKLKSDGLSIRKIAKQIGVAPSTVQRYLKHSPEEQQKLDV